MKLKIDWQAFKKSVIEQAKGAAIKAALKALLGAGYMLGFKAWLVKFIITELFDEIGEPLIKAGFIRLGYYYDRVNGEIIVKRIHQAKEDNNAQDYDNATDDLFTARK